MCISKMCIRDRVVVVEENPSASAVRDEGSEITGREKQRQNAKVSVDKKQIGIDVGRLY